MNDVLEYKGYYASVHFSSEDDVFYGKIVAIDDLVNFEGASVDIQCPHLHRPAQGRCGVRRKQEHLAKRFREEGHPLCADEPG